MIPMLQKAWRWLFGEPKPRPMTFREIMAEFEAASRAEMDAVQADIHRQLDELQAIADEQLEKQLDKE
jgi:hypothetical protein